MESSALSILISFSSPPISSLTKTEEEEEEIFKSEKNPFQISIIQASRHHFRKNPSKKIQSFHPLKWYYFSEMEVLVIPKVKTLPPSPPFRISHPHLAIWVAVFPTPSCEKLRTRSSSVPADLPLERHCLPLPEQRDRFLGHYRRLHLLPRLRRRNH